jgi:hypothetical protein
MSRKTRKLIGRTLAVSALVLAGAPANAAEPGLAVLMERMQTYTHKLQLSMAAENAPLAGFYLHELEETAEFIIENIESYDDQPVGQLTAQMFMPAVELLEDAVDDADWAAGEQRFGALMEACNSCHVASGHGEIRIVPASSNPFAQDFAVQAD